jgi:predicted small secreted protein
MKKIVSLIVILSMLSFTIFTAGCSTTQGYQGATIGGAVGGVAGALLDKKNRFRGGIIGAALGAVLGGTLAERAAKKADEAAMEAAETNRRVEKQVNDDPDKKIRIVAAPVNRNEEIIYQAENGQTTKCKKIRKTIYVNGQVQSDSAEEVCEAQKTSAEY